MPIDWDEHARECPLDWEHNGFDDIRPRPGQEPAKDDDIGRRCTRTHTSGFELPEPARKMLAQIMIEGGSYAHADAMTCPEHGQFVSFIFGVPMPTRERVLLVNVSMDVAADHDALWREFKKSCVKEAGALTAEVVAKMVQPLADLNDVLRKTSGSVGDLGAAIDDARRQAESDAMRKIDEETPPPEA